MMLSPGIYFGQYHHFLMSAAVNGRYKSLDGNKHAQIFAHESFFATAYPMEHKSSIGQALKQFISNFGIPDKLVCDGSAEQVGKRTEFQSTVWKNSIDLHVTKPHRHNQSKVEGVVWEIRKCWFRVMLKKKVPKQLWDYSIKWICEVMQCTAGDLSRRTALEQLTGETPEISEYLDFTFYNWCWYNDNARLGEMKLDRWLGVSHHVGNLMSYWILTQKGNIILCTTVVENSSSRFYLISCSQGILNSSRLSCYLLLRLLVYMYLSQLMRTFTNYLKCIVISF